MGTEQAGRLGLSDADRKRSAIEWCDKTITHHEKAIEDARQSRVKLVRELEIIEEAERRVEAHEEAERQTNAPAGDKLVALVRECGT